ncbi:MAG: zf-HC2 domain-containing protein [Candidatus Aminicenantes bacterium]|nr:zf-HC2 domain-containing protein [Candidatus Aminicenantes bacterium]
MEKNNCSVYKNLMMGLMDNELTEEESINLNKHLIRCSSCRDEYSLLSETSAKLEGMVLKEPDDKILDKVWKSPYSRFARKAGLIMVILGWLIMMLYSAYELLFIKETDSIPGFAFVIILTGLAILFITVLRDRIKTYKTDPYKEVDR